MDGRTNGRTNGRTDGRLCVRISVTISFPSLTTEGVPKITWRRKKGAFYATRTQISIPRILFFSPAARTWTISTRITLSSRLHLHTQAVRLYPVNSKKNAQERRNQLQCLAWIPLPFELHPHTQILMNMHEMVSSFSTFAIPLTCTANCKSRMRQCHLINFRSHPLYMHNIYARRAR